MTQRHRLVRVLPALAALIAALAVSGCYVAPVGYGYAGYGAGYVYRPAAPAYVYPYRPYY